MSKWKKREMAYSKVFEGDKSWVGKSLGVRLMMIEKCWSKQLPSNTVETNKPNPDETVS